MDPHNSVEVCLLKVTNKQLFYIFLSLQAVSPSAEWRKNSPNVLSNDFQLGAEAKTGGLDFSPPDLLLRGQSRREKRRKVNV